MACTNNPGYTYTANAVVNSLWVFSPAITDTSELVIISDAIELVQVDTPGWKCGS